MRVALDTNVIMDALQERSPFDADAIEILRRAQNREFVCLFTANAATDIFYLFSKAREVQSAKAALGFLLDCYEVLPVTHDDCKAALSLPIEDFKDALVVVCAGRAKADCIVTRDKDFLQVASPVELVSPVDFISRSRLFIPCERCYYA
jgi:predicted nucleic acid-binding protein